MITVEQLQALPILYQVKIAQEHLDFNGHLNARWYLAFLSEASWEQYALIGMNRDYFQSGKGGAFTLKLFLQFFAEMQKDDLASVRVRVLGYSSKRIHYMGFLVNETKAQLSCTAEGLDTHADLVSRRTSPYPEDIATKIDKMLGEHRQLDWEMPVSGAIEV
jgi:acyl-CoA thioester hydrolase